jgi:hypothetical protein
MQDKLQTRSKAGSQGDFYVALPAARDQVQNWIDFSKAVIDNTGPISTFVYRQNYEPIVHCRLQLL